MNQSCDCNITPNMSEEIIVKWIQDELITKILKNCDLAEAAIKQNQVRAMEGMKDNWASSMFVIDVQLAQECNEKPLNLILKIMNEDERVREKMQSHKQFFNEIHFYATLLPFFTSQVPSQLRKNFENLIPECYYSYYSTDKKPESYQDAIIVMENLKLRDFKLGDRLSLDFKHCSLAMRSLGVFHAFSYFSKESNFDSFMKNIVMPIQETNYDPKDSETWNKIFGLCEQRVIDALAAEVPNDDFQLDRLRNLAARNAFDVFTELVKPCEPQSVLCHGDYLRNNVLFRYDNDNPVEMKIIDFQTIRYASPVIDVSTFICMNTTHELRAAHFNELLHVYHTSLIETLASLYNKSEQEIEKKYSFQSFMEEFRHRAAYGYLISVEFVLWMYAEEDELEAFIKVYWDKRGSPEHLELLRNLGGDNATRVLVELAKDLIKEKCL